MKTQPTPRMYAAFKQFTSTTPRMNWQLDQCYKEGCKLERELAAVTEQRDRLAEALREIANEDYRGPRPWSANIAHKALAALKGGSHE
jgi:hypothetical protein